MELHREVMVPAHSEWEVLRRKMHAGRLIALQSNHEDAALS